MSKSTMELFTRQTRQCLLCSKRSLALFTAGKIGPCPLTARQKNADNISKYISKELKLRGSYYLFGS